MKNNLFALLWAICILPATAQKTLPTSLQPYTGALNNQVTKALEITGFDLKPAGTGRGKQLADDRSGALQLDSTKTFTGYDFLGLEDSLPAFRTIYQYPQPKVETQTEYQFENETWITLSRSTINKDDQHRIVGVYSESFDPDKGDFVPDSKAIVYPHKNSQDLMDSIFVYGMDTLGVNWILLFFTTNAYDAQDRLTESITSFDYFGQPLLFKDVHTYDAQGDNTLIESFALFNGAEIPSGKTELKYANHQVTQEIAFVADGIGGFMAQSKIIYSYTAAGLLEQVRNYEWSLDANDWAQTQSVTNGYDAVQRINSREKVLYNQDGTEQRDRSEFAYVEGENLAMESYYYWDIDAFFLNNRKFYYYSDGTLSDKEADRNAQHLAVSPNPATDLARLNLEVPATVCIYNNQGEMVMNVESQPNSAISIQGLPSGLYFIAARSEKGQFVGKMIKE